MYNNTGKTIKNIATICAMVEMFICIFSGLTLILAFVYLGTKTGGSEIPDLVLLAIPIVGIIIAVVGCLFASTKYLLLAGFGELIQNTYELSNDVKDIKEIINDGNIDDNDAPDDE